MKPTSQTLDEADRADLVYQYVLAQVGAKTVVSVLALWQGVPAGQAAQTASSWLDRVVALVLARRTQARALGLAHYRMVRALRTGLTIAHPLNEAQPERVSLERLRQEFEALVAELTGEGTTEVSASEEPDGDDDSVEVEALEGLQEALAADLTATQPYLEGLLGDMAETASNKVAAIPEGTPLGDARQATKDMHVQHGSMLAAAAARTAMNGARNASNQASAQDARVIGWVRQHGQSDQPCYFCSMLISRRVLYKSAGTAGQGRSESVSGKQFLGNGIAKFHDNCHCTAEPLYSDESFGTSAKFQMNRYYGDLWDKHIKGKYSGDDAVNEWRKLLRRIRANATTPAAQEAA